MYFGKIDSQVWRLIHCEKLVRHPTGLFAISEPQDQEIGCCSGTSCDGFGSSEIVKGYVGHGVRHEISSHQGKKKALVAAQ